ncbi:MAG: Uma2 family endonuclease [Planctomycetota bacterium]
MIATAATKPGPSKRGQPAWEIAELFPVQGDWSEEEYLDLDTNRLVELTDGFIEVLPMPTVPHQFIVAFLFKALDAFVSARMAGKVLMSGLRVRLRSGKFREPDVVFLPAGHDGQSDQYWSGVDLVMEVVSEGGRTRDLVQKRKDYALAGVREYWIVDPRKEEITVLKLVKGSKRYVKHGVFKSGSVAASALLNGFAVDVAAVFAAAK